MPALLLSSLPSATPQGNASVSPAKPPAKPGAASDALTPGAFGEKLNASLAAAKKTNVEPTAKSDAANAGRPVSGAVFEDMNAALQGLTNHLEGIDLEPLNGLRSFLEGQDLSPSGLQTMQAGGELPAFFAELTSFLSGTADLSALSDDQIASLDSAIGILNTILMKLDPASLAEMSADQQALFGYSLSVPEGVNPNTLDRNKPETALAWQKYDPQQLSGGMTGQSGERFVTHGLLAETDQSFQLHMQSMNSEQAGELFEFADNPALDSLLESVKEPKESASVNKFSDLQLRTLSDSLKPYSTTLSTPVNAQEWADEMSQKIVWFTGRNIQAAEMHLNPADLGPIDVKINVQNDVASISFNVQNASVRELLESNVARLREMMASNGVDLGEVNVESGSRDNQQEAHSSPSQAFGNGMVNASGEEAELENSVRQVVTKNLNLVDYFV